MDIKKKKRVKFVLEQKNTIIDRLAKRCSQPRVFGGRHCSIGGDQVKCVSGGLSTTIRGKQIKKGNMVGSNWQQGWNSSYVGQKIMEGGDWNMGTN